MKTVQPGEGLSPLARGNPLARHLQNLQRGPIPARAGEPMLQSRGYDLERAYPRSRGGTVPMTEKKSIPPGLSPLARGNLSWMVSNVVVKGPIPARAGEPCHPYQGLIERWAYPRSRGGTQVRQQRFIVHTGLSPLARGNQSRSRRVCSG